MNQDLNVLPQSERMWTGKAAALRCLEFCEALQHEELPVELENGEKTNQYLIIVLSNMVISWKWRCMYSVVLFGYRLHSNSWAQAPIGVGM